MAEWGFVENNEIKELHDLLPKNWKNISGLNKSTDIEFLRSLGWYPVVKRYQSYNDITHKITGYRHTLVGNEIEEYQVLEELPPPVETPQPDFNFLKQQFMQELRQERNKRLEESDWTQLVDTNELLGEEQANAWKIYRQKLRDLPELYENTTDLSIYSVQWPEM